ncbi:MAG: hypothetical protein A2284_12105, partial [Deltaproteobacteria bacterium RIFOXYA12_FULL_61_11]
MYDDPEGTTPGTPPEVLPEADEQDVLDVEAAPTIEAEAMPEEGTFDPNFIGETLEAGEDVPGEATQAQETEGGAYSPRYVYLVKLPNECRGYRFCSPLNGLQRSTRVLVATRRGPRLGTVTSGPMEIPGQEARRYDRVIRVANAKDISIDDQAREREQQAFTFCQHKIVEFELPMKLLRVDFVLREGKALFFFSSEQRIDFRQLVRDLASEYKLRIQMIQVGVRDESRLVGALGTCGRECCCASFLRDFAPISIKMAKEQQLALNPQKLSGMCGRLKCCLGYEYDCYRQLLREFPKQGTKVERPEGRYTVQTINLLRGTVVLLPIEGGDPLLVRHEDLQGPAVEETERKEQPARGESLTIPQPEETSRGNEAVPVTPGGPTGEGNYKERQLPPARSGSRSEHHRPAQQPHQRPHQRPEPPVAMQTRTAPSGLDAGPEPGNEAEG